jgi:hypothetical protein
MLLYVLFALHAFQQVLTLGEVEAGVGARMSSRAQQSASVAGQHLLGLLAKATTAAAGLRALGIAPPATSTAAAAVVAAAAAAVETTNSTTTTGEDPQSDTPSERDCSPSMFGVTETVGVSTTLMLVFTRKY